MEGSSTAVADAINGNARALDNLISLVAFARFQVDEDKENSPIFLENLLLLLYNSVMHRNQNQPWGETTLENTLDVLDPVLLDPAVEARASRCIGLVKRIYVEFVKLKNLEERYIVLDKVINSKAPVINAWLGLLGKPQTLAVKRAVVELIYLIAILGKPEHTMSIATSGLLSHARSLMLLNDEYIGNRVTALLGYLADVDDTYNVVAFIYGNAQIIPLCVEHITRFWK